MRQRAIGHLSVHREGHFVPLAPGMAIPLLLKTICSDHQQKLPYSHTSQLNFDSALVIERYHKRIQALSG